MLSPEVGEPVIIGISIFVTAFAFLYSHEMALKNGVEEGKGSYWNVCLS